MARRPRPPASCCRRSSTRTPISSCRICAARIPPGRAASPTGCGRCWPPRRESPDPAIHADRRPPRRPSPRRADAGTGLVRRREQHACDRAARCARQGCRRSVFHELLGFTVADPGGARADARARIAAAAAAARGGHGDIRFSVAPHAPYSVSPALFDAIRRDASAHGVPTTVHLAESREEVQLLADGYRPVARPARDARRLDRCVAAAGRVAGRATCGTSASSTRRTLVVHGVQFTAERPRACCATSGPRWSRARAATRYVGVGSPPLEAFYAVECRWRSGPTAWPASTT